MRARFRSRLAIGIAAIVIVVVVTLIFVGYRFDGTGFNGYNKVTIAHTISGTNTGTVIKTEEYQPGKSLWDWLQLLFVPAVLTLGAVWITSRQNHDLQIAEQQHKAERALAEQQHEADRDIALDNQREEALQAYIDSMSELLLHENLRSSTEDSEVRKIARVRTLTVLPKLDSNRKRSVLNFLYESGLINKDNRIIDLSGANLRGADLGGADLRLADLSGTDLGGANLSRADLREAYLSGANLSQTNLIEADLNGANLSYAKLIFANLLEADLRGTFLLEADLGGADLGGAKLADALVTPKQLDQARSLKGATIPDGSIRP